LDLFEPVLLSLVAGAATGVGGIIVLMLGKRACACVSVGLLFGILFTLMVDVILS